MIGAALAGQSDNRPFLYLLTSGSSFGVQIKLGQRYYRTWIRSGFMNPHAHLILTAVASISSPSSPPTTMTMLSALNLRSNVEPYATTRRSRNLVLTNLYTTADSVIRLPRTSRQLADKTKGLNVLSHTFTWCAASSTSESP